MELEPSVWGPHYWFVLHTIAFNYPLKPNEVAKKKYYDLISNLPLFLPGIKIADSFSQLLDAYPVTPYLDNRESFVKWVHFIHNKINTKLGKPEISLADGLDKYYYHYKPKDELFREKLKIKEKYIFTFMLMLLCSIIYYLYNV
jgi:hypothetical protein